MRSPWRLDLAGGYDEGMELPRFYQISLRTILEIVAVIAVILAMVYQRGRTSQRYQMMSSPRLGGGSEVFMYDAESGQVWERNFNGSWTPATLPGLHK